MTLDKYDVIILDCDGVIFDSNLLKIEAFKRVLCDFDPILVGGFIDFFKNNFGTSRYTLVKVFLEKFLEEDYDERRYLNILDRFGHECLKLYATANYTNCFFDFLNKYKDKELYVASGSDEAELRSVFQQRNITNYFNCIYGSPAKKAELVRTICDLNPGKIIVMIGDAKSDLAACRENKIDFLFMQEFSTNREMKKDIELEAIFNLGELV